MNVSELIVMPVSLFVVGMGVFGLISPAALVGFVASWQSKYA